MSVSHSIGDMLTKIRNASNAKHRFVNIKSSNFKREIINLLKEEGFIRDFKELKEGNTNLIKVFLNYDDTRKPVINGIKAISTPGRKVYSSYKKMPRILNGYGTLVVSSSKGVISGKNAKLEKLGGELICCIW